MKATTKIFFQNICIYPLGAIIWGLICLYCGAISSKDFLHIFSSFAVLIIPVFFFCSYFFLQTKFTQIEEYAKRKQEKDLLTIQKSIKTIPLFMVTIVILWGTIGPLIGSLSLIFPGMGFILKERSINISYIFLLMMFGYACVFLIFIPFVLMLFSNLEKYTGFIPVSEDSLISVKMKMRISGLFTNIGTIFLLVSSIVAVILKHREAANFTDILLEKVSVISFLAISMAIINTSLTTRQILIPINKLKEVILGMFKNSRNGEIDLMQKVEIDTRDELSLVLVYFNDFLAFMRKIIGSFKDLAIKAKELSVQVARGSQESSVSLEEMKKVIESMRNLTANLNEKIDGSASASNEIKNFFANLNNLINNQASSITESSAALEEMSSSIANVKNISEEKQRKAGELEKVANTGENNMKETMQNIKKVTDSINIIINMIKVIKSIAGTTNLLSMNAAIEAAHAGDYGKGFSIVADEIRSLAESVTRHSTEITKSVKEIITSINTSGTTTNKTAQSLAEIVENIKNFSNSLLEMKNAMEENATGISEITNGLSNLVGVTEEIATSSQAMVDRIENIDDILRSLKNASTETKNGMEEIQAGINGIYNTVESISNASAQNDKNVEILNQYISNIKI